MSTGRNARRSNETSKLCNFETLQLALSLSPFQFCSQHFEEGAADSQQMDPVVRFTADHPIFVANRRAYLAVNAEIRLLLAGLHNNFDLRGVAHHQRAMR